MLALLATTRCWRLATLATAAAGGARRRSASFGGGVQRRYLAGVGLRLAFAALAVLLAVAAGSARAERIRDLATVQGVRANALIGYGLVVGLDGSGDQTTQTPFTVQSLQSMLTQLGITLPPGTRLQLKNVAAVMVTAMLPPFAQPGQPLDVTVSSLGDAKSLRGGTLLMTPLKGADGQLYAVAQGNVLVGGAGASQGGAKVQINHLSAGRIPGGATVERAVASPFPTTDRLRLELASGDFSTAAAMVDSINRRFGDGTSAAFDARVIEVRAPADSNERVRFMADLENLEVALPQPSARVIINARTGSIVMNRAVTLEPAAVAHGSLSVTISSQPVISQPPPFSAGQTVVTERTDIQIKQDGGNLMQLTGGANLADVVQALNALGANAQDLLAILQALKAAGSLRADLEVI
jgi:flagellar P-ring protein precursor FlgI